MPDAKERKVSTAEMFEAIADRVEDLGNMIYEATQGIVQNGPFTGQQLVRNPSWGMGDMCSKLLGTYEAELHDALEKAIRKLPDLVINVGCAEGYYAVGLAQRLPLGQVYAFDIDDQAQSVCKQAAIINGVNTNLSVNGECTAQIIKDLVSETPEALIILDCEGAEIDLMAQDVVNYLINATLIIECHDHIDDQITPTLQQRISDTHNIQLLREGPRDPSGYKMLEPLSTFDRWMAVCEFRPTLMHWLIATPKL